MCVLFLLLNLGNEVQIGGLDVTSIIKVQAVIWFIISGIYHLADLNMSTANHSLYVSDESISRKVNDEKFIGFEIKYKSKNWYSNILAFIIIKWNLGMVYNMNT